VSSSTKFAALMRCKVEFWHKEIVREWPRKNSLKSGFSSI
jgi:hypothetical protein